MIGSPHASGCDAASTARWTLGDRAVHLLHALLRRPRTASRHRDQPIRIGAAPVDQEVVVGAHALEHQLGLLELEEAARAEAAHVRVQDLRVDVLGVHVREARLRVVRARRDVVVALRTVRQRAVEAGHRDQARRAGGLVADEPHVASLDALHVRHRVAPFFTETRDVHTSCGSVMCVSVSMARMRSNSFWLTVHPPCGGRLEQRCETRGFAGTQLAAQPRGQPFDVVRGTALDERVVEIARDALELREARCAELGAERSLERVDRGDRVGDQLGAALRQREQAAAAVARIGLAHEIALRLELAGGGVDRLARHALLACDLADARALGPDLRDHVGVRHLEPGVSARDRLVHQLLRDARRDHGQHADRAPRARSQCGVGVHGDAELLVEHGERGCEALIVGGADERAVLGVALGQDRERILDERAAARGQPHDARAPVLGIRAALEVPGGFDQAHELAARLRADRELGREQRERAVFAPDPREQRREARAQPAVTRGRAACRAAASARRVRSRSGGARRCRGNATTRAIARC
jgi:hypothetical protein